MIEVITETVTDLDDTETEVTMRDLVCDRCGFAFPKDKLTRQNGFNLCKDCLDEE